MGRNLFCWAFYVDVPMSLAIFVRTPACLIEQCAATGVAAACDATVIMGRCLWSDPVCLGTLLGWHHTRTILHQLPDSLQHAVVRLRVEQADGLKVLVDDAEHVLVGLAAHDL